MEIVFPGSGIAPKGYSVMGLNAWLVCDSMLGKSDS
jgi:hypothetical protein